MVLLYRWTDFPDFWIGTDLVRVGVDLRYIFFLLDLNQYLDGIDGKYILIIRVNILPLVSMNTTC